jgi:hypothetical protein
MRPAIFVLLCACAAACTTYRDDLQRGREAYEQNSYERALQLFRAIENDTSELTTAERAQYAYLRGMTDYRIGYKADARHWLLLAKHLDDGAPGTLATDWRARMTEALTELNEAVYAGGASSLENRRTGNAPEKPKAKKSEDEP